MLRTEDRGGQASVTTTACYRVTYFGCGVYLANKKRLGLGCAQELYLAVLEIRSLYVHPSFDLTCVGALVGRSVPRCVALLRSAGSGVEDDPHRVWRVVREPDEHLLRTLHHLAHLVLLQVVVHLPQPRAVLAARPAILDMKGQIENADRLKEPRGDSGGVLGGVLWGLRTQGGTLRLLRLWGLVAEEALVDVIERDRPAARRDVKLDQIAHFLVEPKDGGAHQLPISVVAAKLDLVHPRRVGRVGGIVREDGAVAEVLIRSWRASVWSRLEYVPGVVAALDRDARHAKVLLQHVEEHARVAYFVALVWISACECHPVVFATLLVDVLHHRPQAHHKVLLKL
eukprot:scaffold64764_cov66-Phaeocystis_antarctica.AAC.2